MGLTQVNSEGIKDGEIKDADVNASAAIAGSKLAAATTSAAGSMSAADKTKLDGVATSATANPSAPALTGSTDNTICTVTGANAIQGEANLTFDGSDLAVGAGNLNVSKPAIPTVLVQNSTDTSYSTVKLQQSSGSGGYFAVTKLGTNSSATGGANAAQLWQSADAAMVFGTNNTERGRFESGGAFQVQDDIKIMTSGKGIDFSAVSHASGMTSELLDAYEEGTWTPAIYYQDSGDTGDSSNLAQYGWYTRVGNLVSLGFFLRWTLTGSAANDNIGVSGIPFAISAITSTYGHAGSIGSVSHSGTSLSSTAPIILKASSNGQSILYLEDPGSQGNYGNEFGANSGMRLWGGITYRI